MDPSTILALISELYGTVGRLSAENTRLRDALAAKTPPPPTEEPPEEPGHVD